MSDKDKVSLRNKTLVQDGDSGADASRIAERQAVADFITWRDLMSVQLKTDERMNKIDGQVHKINDRLQKIENQISEWRGSLKTWASVFGVVGAIWMLAAPIASSLLLAQCGADP